MATIDSSNMRGLLSKEAEQVLETGIGYRCLDQATSDFGEYKPMDVFDDEINNLGNEDIPDTIENLYHNKLIKPKDIDIFCKFILKSDYYNVIWLTSDPLDAVEYYSDGYKRFDNLSSAIHNDGTSIPVNKYILPKKRLLLSDLGNEGQLFAYAENSDNKMYVESIN